jgi:hypothetical protein
MGEMDHIPDDAGLRIDPNRERGAVPPGDRERYEPDPRRSSTKYLPAQIS